MYKSSSDLSLLTRVITISGNSLTLNTEYTFLSSSITYFDYIEKLSNSSALVVYQYYTGSTYELRVAVLTISGTTVSIGSYLTISTNTSYWSAYALKFDTDKVILVYRTGGTYFTFCVATISGTSVTKGTALADIYYGSTTDFWGYVVSNTNVVIILSSYLYMLQIKTTDVLITSRKDVNFGYKPGATISVDYTTDEVFFILFQSATSGNYKIYGYLMDFVLQAKGIAKQSGTAGQQIKVMTL
ncbi:hypothetical protein [Caloramator sp. Dgby_cultured_2]|uniref:hypothetical protein n=1 Tax=Caloramator sp. Dgby_cultured_2 TaxID=3029174 RepID=UPI00237ED7FA|nr:hypothetical protein [Caloramator sp. Dgby_cultured_2]WDU82258.1 hypothetical protein PWK10_11165 [Caloramator sp. Dgby_cultured_2]